VTNSARQVSIVLADDHPVVLQGVEAILRAEPSIAVLASCPDGLTALEAIRDLTPDIALLDIAMPDPNGLDILAVLALDPSSRTKVVFLTAVAGDEQVLAAIDNGARGIVLKDAAPDTLIECLRTVMAGRQWFPPELVDGAKERVAASRAERKSFQESLSLRERDIALLVADGLSNKEIADRLALTEGTIKIYLHKIYTKINVPNRTTLAKLVRTYNESSTG
jgi:two-component system, NarL family, nitrate/nitrite response regulator NarL